MTFAHPSIVVVSGPMGAGKTTIGTALATRLDRAAIINGYRVQQLIASGLSSPRSQLEADATAGAFAEQLRVRLRASCALAKSFVAAGFTAIIEEHVVGERVEHLLEDLAGTPFSFIQLGATFDALTAREQARGTDGYLRWGDWSELLEKQTRKIGLWLDTTDRSADETLAEILDRAPEARVERRLKPTLYLMCGLPCSGKTTRAKELARARRAIRLTPDEWMETLFGDDRARIDAARYPVEAVAWRIAEQALTHGIDAILDFGLLGRDERDEYRGRADALGARAEIVYLDVPHDELIRRLEQRNADLPEGCLHVERELVDRYWVSFERPAPDELDPATS
jgi:predicted kinase